MAGGVSGGHVLFVEDKAYLFTQLSKIPLLHAVGGGFSEISQEGHEMIQQSLHSL